ncbi:hypothetical protein CFBP5507_16110 [Agrobacterium salinitolerans]|uniref:Uncharacterized protein n=1 Tax=Agrobacterium salinitolerans TaxID=1183413 RepID=A0A9X9PBE9_9HYPH|nr:hypothetical protein [Agrobacterium salinitolerans]UYZ09238.1 hypothetical protein CFBP5507_16110 [Agrobacterium salinitolerans]
MMPNGTSGGALALRERSHGRTLAGAFLLLLAMLLLVLAHMATGPRPISPHVL